MKRIFIYTTLMISILATSACQDILEQESEVFITNDDAIIDLESAKAALNGMYDALQDGDLYGSNHVFAGELASGNAVWSGFNVQYQELAEAQVSISNFHVEDNWVDFYFVINIASIIIERVGSLEDIPAEDANRIIGSAHFFRGLCHFDLLRQYGEFFDENSEFGVPLVTGVQSGIVAIPRSDVASTYTAIETDLNEAIRLLSNSSDSFYASKKAAEALLARVYLYKGDYQEAINLATEVIDNGGYSLVEDYNSIYLSEDTNEPIFQLNFTTQDGSNFTSLMLAPNPEVSTNPNLLTQFEGGDTERSTLFVEDANADGQINCLKYGDNQNEPSGNAILIRLAEMYLIRAEAHAMQSQDPVDGLDDINMIRSRVGLPDIQAAQVPDMESFVDILVRELRSEFAFEGHYWFDLVRLGRIEEVRNIDSFRRIFPIPLREITATEGVLVQNPGYNN